jgi:hypothetical protein
MSLNQSRQERKGDLSAARQAGYRNRPSRATTLFLNTTLAGALLLGASAVSDGRAEMPAPSFELLEATIPQLQAALTAGSVRFRLQAPRAPPVFVFAEALLTSAEEAR